MAGWGNRFGLLANQPTPNGLLGGYAATPRNLAGILSAPEDLPGYKGLDAAQTAKLTPSRIGNAAYDAIVGPIVSGITAPKDAMDGKFNPSSAEGIARVFDTAMMGQMSGAAGGPSGAIGSGPMRAYHGSPQAGLQELLPSARGPLGQGVYLSPYENVAKRYSGDGGMVYQHDLPDVFNGLGSRFTPSDVSPYKVWRDQAEKLVAAAPSEHQANISELAARMSPEDGYPFFARLSQMLGGQDSAQDLFRSAGFKGISGHVDGPEISYFDRLSGQ